MTDLLASFAALPVSPNPGGNQLSFHTVPVVAGKPHCLAKTDQGYPCLLLVTERGTVDIPTPIRLENLRVQHGLTGKIHGKGELHHAEFSLVTLQSEEESLVEVFLRFSMHLATDLPDEPKPRAVGLEIRRLVEMLQSLRKEGSKTIQGLWGELFLIERSNDPNRWVLAWHSDPLDLHDFCFPTQRVEVKTSATKIRKHFFSHHQLRRIPDSSTYIASMFVEKATNGLSIDDLATRVRPRLAPDAALKLDETIILTLGSSYHAAKEVHFDAAQAVASIKFFPLQAVPQLPSVLPDRVFDVSYSVLLNETDGLMALPVSDLHFP